MVWVYITLPSTHKRTIRRKGWWLLSSNLPLHAYDPSTHQMGTGGLEVQDYPWLPSESKPGYITPGLINIYILYKT